jgi:metallophosphoesterase superfamily enzyme
MVLVEGNHDLRAGPPPPGLGLRIESEPWREGPLAFYHHPQAVDGLHAVAGHLHPCVRLNGRAESLRLPCFWLQHELLMLPAYGEFTGGASIARVAGDRVVAIAEDRLFEIPAIPPTA